MTPEELMQEVYDHFHSKGEWPLARELQLSHRNAHIRPMARGIGWQKLACGDGPEGRCVLQLAEFINRTGADEDLSLFLRAIRFSASLYAMRGTIPVSSSEFATELGLTEIELKRLGGMLSIADRITTGGSWSPDNSGFSIYPAERILFFEHVRSMDQYFALQQKLDSDEIESRRSEFTGWGEGGSIVTEESSGSFGVKRYSLRDPALEALVASDLDELNRVMQASAWKATAILAGSCLESLLLDIWRGREEEAKRRFAGAWPNGVKGHELASAAVQAGYLSDDQRQLASVLRRWRNLVHPAAALRSAEPTEELAQLLVAMLRLLLAELTRDTRVQP
jgi:hypothetical protein